MRLFETLSGALSLPAAYRLFRRVVGTREVWRTYLDGYVKPVPGEKVLDLGCGPGDVLDYLDGLEYTGLDISPEYIEAARKRYGARGRFWCSDVGAVSLKQEAGTFDLVLVTGVLHHLSDDEASRLFGLARLALRASGRLVTFDGCFVPQQSRAARWLLRRDRGRFVRTQPEYERLASAAFRKVECYLRHDLLRVPYTHLIMLCQA